MRDRMVTSARRPPVGGSRGISYENPAVPGRARTSPSRDISGQVANPGSRVCSLLCCLVLLVLGSPKHMRFVPVDWGQQRAIWSHSCCVVYGVRAPTEHPSDQPPGARSAAASRRPVPGVSDTSGVQRTMIGPSRRWGLFQAVAADALRPNEAELIGATRIGWEQLTVLARRRGGRSWPPRATPRRLRFVAGALKRVGELRRTLRPAWIAVAR